jgi:hypothetical protein
VSVVPNKVSGVWVLTLDVLVATIIK